MSRARALLLAVAICVGCVVGGLTLVASPGGPAPIPATECGGQPSLRIPQYHDPRAALLFCGPDLSYAALAFGPKDQWWLVADRESRPNSVPISAGVGLLAIGQQIYAQLPSPCSFDRKLSVRPVPAQLLIARSPIAVQAPPHFKLSDYLKGGTRPTC